MNLLLEFKRLGETFQGISQASVILLVILQGFTLSMILLEWHCLARGMGLRLPFCRLFHVHMTGTFIEGITPSFKAGGEAVKIVLLKGCGVSAGAGTGLVLLQKAASLTVFMALNLIAAAGLYVAGTRDTGAFIAGGLIVLLLFCLLLIMLLSFPAKGAAVIAALPMGTRFQKAAASAAEEMRTAVGRIRLKKKVLGTAVLLSVFIWTLYGVKAILIAQALGLSAGVFTVVVTTYSAYMAGMIPLLPGGTGAFEGACVLLLSVQGVPVSQAVAFSLLLRAITFWLPFGVSALYAGFYGLLRLHRRPTLKVPGTEGGP